MPCHVAEGRYFLFWRGVLRSLRDLDRRCSAHLSHAQNSRTDSNTCLGTAGSDVTSSRESFTHTTPLHAQQRERRRSELNSIPKCSIT